MGAQRGIYPGSHSCCSSLLTGHPSLSIARSVLKPSTLPGIQVTDAEAVPNTEAPRSGAGEPGMDADGFGWELGAAALRSSFIGENRDLFSPAIVSLLSPSFL